MRCVRRNLYQNRAETVENPGYYRGLGASIPVQGPAIFGHDYQRLAARDVEVVTSHVSREKRAQMNITNSESIFEKTFRRWEAAAALVP
jgi:hypothetical protein